MKKIVRLTESDLTRIIRRIIKEGTDSVDFTFKVGGMYKIKNPDGTDMRFKIDKIDKSTDMPRYYGSILGVNGKITGEKPNKVLKVGDKVHFDLDHGMGRTFITYYIPSIDGEQESGSVTDDEIIKLS